MHHVYLFCPIVCEVLLNVSINETAPVVVNAALLTGEPFGLSCDISIPQPPPYENVLAKYLLVSYISSILSPTGGNT